TLGAITLDYFGERAQAVQRALYGRAADAAADCLALHALEPGVEVFERFRGAGRGRRGRRHPRLSRRRWDGSCTVSCVALGTGDQGQQQGTEQEPGAAAQHSLQYPHAPFSPSCEADAFDRLLCHKHSRLGNPPLPAGSALGTQRSAVASKVMVSPASTKTTAPSEAT